MAQFPNNAFTIDTNDQHGHREGIFVVGKLLLDWRVLFRKLLVT